MIEHKARKIHAEHLAHHLFGGRALYGYLAPVVGIVENAYLIAFCIAQQPLIVLVDIRGVDDEKEGIVGIFFIYQKIVHRTAVGIEHHSIKDLAGFHETDVVREDVIHELLGLGAVDEYLAHMGYIEDAGTLADGIVFLGDGTVLDGHIEAGERAHFGSQGEMLAVEAGHFILVIHIDHQAGLVCQRLSSSRSFFSIIFGSIIATFWKSWI